MRVFSMIFGFLNSIRKANDKFCNDLSDYNNKKIMELSFSIEENFLLEMSKQAKVSLTNNGYDSGSDYIKDHADDLCFKINMLNDLFDSNKKSILEYKKDFFLHDFKVIKAATVTDVLLQDKINKSFDALMLQRNKIIDKLKIATKDSESFANIFCIYLARSNYPIKNAFEILPIEMSAVFDKERKKSKHLKGVKLLVSMV